MPESIFCLQKASNAWASTTNSKKMALLFSKVRSSFLSVQSNKRCVLVCKMAIVIDTTPILTPFSKMKPQACLNMCHGIVLLTTSAPTWPNHVFVSMSNRLKCSNSSCSFLPVLQTLSCPSGTPSPSAEACWGEKIASNCIWASSLTRTPRTSAARQPLPFGSRRLSQSFAPASFYPRFQHCTPTGIQSSSCPEHNRPEDRGGHKHAGCSAETGEWRSSLRRLHPVCTVGHPQTSGASLGQCVCSCRNP